MRDDLYVDLFDVWMHASRWPEKDKATDIVPACPLLTQGWNLLGVKEIDLHADLLDLADRLTGSLWTTFQPGVFETLKRLLLQGEIK